jgi:hypothetical protein
MSRKTLFELGLIRRPREIEKSQNTGDPEHEERAENDRNTLHPNEDCAKVRN